MCLIAFAHRNHPRYPLVLVANRDEFHDRPAEPADWWRDQPEVLAGRDRQAGGTWLGVARDGRWAAVTNYREGRAPAGQRSRGSLVAEFLASPGADPLRYARDLEWQSDRYSGFNLLLGKGDQLVYTANRGRSSEALDEGCYTLSNHLLDTPWPKSERARLKLIHALHYDEPPIDTLFDVLADDTPVEDESLLPATGIDPDLERTLSPPFIVGETYGTRCTTVLLMDRQGRVGFWERNFGPGGKRQGDDRVFTFTIDRA